MALFYVLFIALDDWTAFLQLLERKWLMFRNYVMKICEESSLITPQTLNKNYYNYWREKFLTKLQRKSEMFVFFSFVELIISSVEPSLVIRSEIRIDFEITSSGILTLSKVTTFVKMSLFRDIEKSIRLDKDNTFKPICAISKSFLHKARWAIEYSFGFPDIVRII